MIKNRQQGQTLSMFNLSKKKKDSSRKSRTFAGVLRLVREISGRDRQWAVINTTTLYLIRPWDFIETIRVRFETKEGKQF